MDKAIHKHLDRRLDIQDEASAALEKVLNSINLRQVVRNPHAALAQVGQMAMDLAESKAKEASDEGVRFAKEIKEKGKVKVQPGNDPKLNEDQPIV